MDLAILNDLTKIIKERHQVQQNSYTSKLLHSHLDRIAKKIGEEAGEVIIAAKNNDDDELANEAADLIFHLMLLLEKQGLSLDDVCKIFHQRRAKA